ncbi:hypothetical protein [Amycolatopsis albispora]|uniref:Uncharacterized protein n=1 Tax=Amycolatopsis albispora TaxID=1804986 RepID=A0A344LAC2_9PSEU|nr:hypothetical protein [Amycolatopsis albispora]AXB44996.1 hypothetical protein A4R43_22910 [Amycolatopsis albispora]
MSRRRRVSWHQGCARTWRRAWFTAQSYFHLDDVVPGDKKVVDGVPVVSEAHQKQMLRQGLAFAWELTRLAVCWIRRKVIVTECGPPKLTAL